MHTMVDGTIHPLLQKLTFFRENPSETDVEGENLLHLMVQFVRTKELSADQKAQGIETLLVLANGLDRDLLERLGCSTNKKMGDSPLASLLKFANGFMNDLKQDNSTHDLNRVLDFLLKTSPKALFVFDPKNHFSYPAASFASELSDSNLKKVQKTFKTFIQTLNYDLISNEECLMLIKMISKDIELSSLLKAFLLENDIKKETASTSLLSQYYNPQRRMEGDLLSSFKGFPLSEIWRLFVDGLKQVDSEEKGWSGYEKREKDCIQKMFDAFLFALRNKDTITFEFIKAIQALAFPDKNKTRGSGSFPLSSHTLTLKGYYELKEHYSDLSSVSASGRSNNSIRMLTAFSSSSKVRSSDLEARVVVAIKTYYESLELAEQDPIKLLQAMIRFVRTLEIMHPFQDANCRTFMNILLNRELILQGFSPMVLEDPNQLDGHSDAECIDLIIKGMENFQRIKNSGTLSPEAADTASLLKEGLTYPIPALLPFMQRNGANNTNTTDILKKLRDTPTEALSTPQERSYTPSYRYYLGGAFFLGLGLACTFLNTRSQGDERSEDNKLSPF